MRENMRNLAKYAENMENANFRIFTMPDLGTRCGTISAYAILETQLPLCGKNAFFFRNMRSHAIACSHAYCLSNAIHCMPQNIKSLAVCVCLCVCVCARDFGVEYLENVKR